MIGDLVKCIKGFENKHAYGDEKTPTPGNIYTVRDDLGRTIHLEEVVNETRLYVRRSDRSEVTCEPAFSKTHFVPIDTHQIDVFRVLLNPVPSKKRAGAPA